MFAWLVVLGGMIYPISMRLLGKSWSEIASAYAQRNVTEIIHFMLWAACLAAIAHRPWAVRAVLVTALWSIALQSSVLPLMIRGFISPFLSDSDFNMGYNIPVWWGIIYLAYFGSLACIAVPAGWLGTMKPDSKELPAKPQVRFSFAVRVLGAGIALIYFVITLRWLTSWLFSASYDMLGIVTSYVLIGLTIVVMFSQFFIHRHLLATSAMSMSAVALFLPIIAQFLSIPRSRETGAISASCFPPISSFVWETLTMWIPMLLLGWLAFRSKRLGKSIRLTGLAVPVSLMLLAMCAPGLLAGNLFVDSKLSAEKPSDWPDWLVPPEGATEVRYGTSRTFGVKSLHFRMQEPYPAVRVLDAISERMEKAGFSKLEYYLLNPDILSAHSRGWFEHSEAATPGMKVHSWGAEWMNEKDEVVHVGLEYRYPESGAEDANNLTVSIHLHPPVGWYNKEIDKYKQIHGIQEGRDTAGGK